MLILVVLIVATVVRKTDGMNGGTGVKCFSCASSEYRQVLEKSGAFTSRTARTPQFDQFCDNEEAVQHVAPVESCASSCITIYEPHYFGGLQSRERPFLFIRGCAEKIFESMVSRPREVDFLHRAPICVELQLSQIYPHVQANEIVTVCSCTENGCNFRTTQVNSSSRSFQLLTILLCLLFLLQ